LLQLRQAGVDRSVRRLRHVGFSLALKLLIILAGMADRCAVGADPTPARSVSASPTLPARIGEIGFVVATLADEGRGVSRRGWWLDFAKLEIKHQVRPKILKANATWALQLDKARS
jgi:hypothetical protein